MEFPGLGENCHLESCKQLDFLPFKCDACGNVFCKEHSSYDAHQCQHAQSKDRRVPVCPLCNQPIAMVPSDSPDQKVNEHIENDCKSDLARHKRTNKCRVKGCKERQLIPILCNSCKQNFCLRHRHENDHNCSAKSSQSAGQTAASSRAGQAALSRFQQTSNQSSQKRQQPSSKATSSRTQLPQTRTQNPQPRPNMRQNVVATRTNRNPMSEDEALQMAIQASLQEATFQPTNNQQMTQQEIEDMQLARALQQSESDARNQQNKESDKGKDSCVLS